MRHADEYAYHDYYCCCEISAHNRSLGVMLDDLPAIRVTFRGKEFHDFTISCTSEPNRYLPAYSYIKCIMMR